LLKITQFMGNKSQLMWQKGYAIKTKSHIVVDMCIGVPVFLRHSVYCCCIFYGVTSDIYYWECNKLAIQPQSI